LRRSVEQRIAIAETHFKDWFRELTNNTIPIEHVLYAGLTGSSLILPRASNAHDIDIGVLLKGTTETPHALNPHDISGNYPTSIHVKTEAYTGKVDFFIYPEGDQNNQFVLSPHWPIFVDEAYTPEKLHSAIDAVACVLNADWSSSSPESPEGKNAKARTRAIEKDIADLKEQTAEIESRWKNEKQTLGEIKSIKKELESLRIEADAAEAAVDLARAAEIRYGEIPALTADLETKMKRLKKLQSTRRILKEEITESDIAGVVSKWTGIPVSRMLEEEAEKLSRMEQTLEKRVVGQNEAVQKIADAVKRSRAGISDPNRPIASFIFLGPTGVGKTELTKALAEFLFNDDKALIRVDMSEYMEKHSVSKIIGAPPGYVGHEEGGALTELVRHRPYSVILFDEIEKAHPEVFNILLQVLDNGQLTDAKGRRVNFRNTVIIMTSNIGAQYIDKMEQLGLAVGGDTDAANYVQAKEKVLVALKNSFRPEFINRIDEILIFNILSPEAIKDIVAIQIREVVKRLQDKNITLSVTPAVLEYLAKEGYNPHYGARPLRRLIQDKILTKVATLMIGKGVLSGGSVTVDMKNKEFVFDVKKGGKRVKSTVLTEETPLTAK
jgi:ATP-dependent Clp protease ATP-binding subunit ClpB